MYPIRFRFIYIFLLFLSFFILLSLSFFEVHCKQHYNSKQQSLFNTLWSNNEVRNNKIRNNEESNYNYHLIQPHVQYHVDDDQKVIFC